MEKDEEGYELAPAEELQYEEVNEAILNIKAVVVIVILLAIGGILLWVTDFGALLP